MLNHSKTWASQPNGSVREVNQAARTRAEVDVGRTEEQTVPDRHRVHVPLVHALAVGRVAPPQRFELGLDHLPVRVVGPAVAPVLALHHPQISSLKSQRWRARRTLGMPATWHLNLGSGRP